ncbi:molecular chaperone TorD [Halodesulfovibrio marinisediminis]|uniref:TorA specific chaperone n=1 Tax=Halodesulfovibrio marinisediminis DSM 17456 TaxID=1121457 RepID=A0A1N6ECH4_9BACT|nr:molecular chaperone TorD [Halodesulfovibrio marinisediminis]SIN80729.1 TorA specific chaperone [Halodesulfovibrio marinisediminis DSM 17456]
MKKYEPKLLPEVRSALYCWFSSLLGKELTAEQVFSYQQGEGRDWLASLSQIPEFAPWSSTVEARFKKGDASSISLDMSCEFARLFLGAGGMRSVPPYESVFTSGSASTHQQAETDVRSIMADYGLGVSSDFTEPCDHLAVLLEFMSVLCTEDQMVEEPFVSLARQQLFIKEHLLNWLPEFANMCVQVEPDGFYSLVVKGLVSFVQADAKDLQVALSVPKKDNLITMYQRGERV